MWQKIVDWIAMPLTIIGALNWGFIGATTLFGNYWNPVTEILGTGTLTNIIYLLVGLSAVWLIKKAVWK